MKVIIQITRKTEYASIVEMSEEKFNQLAENLKSPQRAIRQPAEKEVNDLINISDWQDDDLESVDEFERANLK